MDMEVVELVIDGLDYPVKVFLGLTSLPPISGRPCLRRWTAGPTAGTLS
jgi:hypothetical protein